MRECWLKHGKGTRSHTRHGKAVQMVRDKCGKVDKHGTEQRSARNLETAGKCEKSEKHTELAISSGRETHGVSARIFYRYFQLHSTYILTILAFATQLSTHTILHLSLDSQLSPSPRHLCHSHTTLFSHSTLTHHSPLTHHLPTSHLHAMPLTTIIWNGVYNTQPLMRLLTKYQMCEHYQNSWYLQMKGVEIADLRYILFYLFKSLRTNNVQQDQVSQSLAGWPPHG